MKISKGRRRDATAFLRAGKVSMRTDCGNLFPAVV